MTLPWREAVTEAFFLLGIFALLLTAMTSASEELGQGLLLQAHPIPLQEAQPTLGLP